MSSTSNPTSTSSAGTGVGDAPPERHRLVTCGLIPERGPKRILATASFINMIGNGLFMTGSALFFTRSVGLPVAQVGLGMGVAALVGLLAGIPVGRLADGKGPRETYMTTLCLQSLAMAALVFVHTFWVFVLVVCVTQLAGSGSQAARGPLVRGFAAPNPTQFRSYLRAVSNLAGSGGAVAAAVAVQLDTRAAYVALILGNALTFVACAAVIARLPRLPPLEAPVEQGRRLALKDFPFVTFTLLDGIMAMHHQVLLFALPLWIVGHTDAPRWFVGVTALLNTVMVVALQVRASRGIDTNTAAAHAMRRSGWAFLTGMALIATTGRVPAWTAALAIVIGVGVHTLGELWHAAASFELSFGLAPAHAQGQYSGLFGMGHGLTNAAAPALLGLLCVTWGAPGWLAMGGVFVVVGLVMPYVVRWAGRSRPDGAPPGPG